MLLLITVATLEQKRIIYRKDLKYTIRKETTLLLAVWEKLLRVKKFLTDSRDINMLNSIQIQNSICKSPISGENTRVDRETLKILDNGAIKQLVPPQWEFRSNNFLVEKKGRGNRPTMSLKSCQQIYSLRAYHLDFLTFF